MEIDVKIKNASNHLNATSRTARNVVRCCSVLYDNGVHDQRVPPSALCLHPHSLTNSYLFAASAKQLKDISVFQINTTKKTIKDINTTSFAPL